MVTKLENRLSPYDITETVINLDGKDAFLLKRLTLPCGKNKMTLFNKKGLKIHEKLFNGDQLKYHYKEGKVKIKTYDAQTHQISQGDYINSHQIKTYMWMENKKDYTIK